MSGQQRTRGCATARVGTGLVRARRQRWRVCEEDRKKGNLVNNSSHKGYGKSFGHCRNK